MGLGGQEEELASVESAILEQPRVDELRRREEERLRAEELEGDRLEVNISDIQGPLRKIVARRRARAWTSSP